MTNRIILVGLAVISVAGLWGGWTWLQPSAEASPAVRPLPVSVVRVEPATRYAHQREYSGVIVARRLSDVGFEHGGKVLTVAVDDGAVVPAGQVLAALDTRQLDAERDQVAGQLREARARLSLLQEGPRDETIAAARSEVDRLEAMARLQTNNLSRREQLWKSQSVSLEEVDQARTNLDAVSAQLSAARHQLDELLTGTRPEDIAAQEAVVAQLEAAARAMEVRFEDSVLRAPFAGTVAKRFVDEGRVVTAGTPIVRIVEDRRLEAQIGVPPDLARHLNEGRTYVIHCDDDDYQATLRAVLPELNARTQTRLAVFDLLPTERTPAVGELARVSLTREVDCDGYWIPATSVQRGERGLWSVFALAESADTDRATVERRDVEILFADVDRVLARGTLSTGDRVVADGLHRLVNRQWVTVINQDASFLSQSAANARVTNR